MPVEIMQPAFFIVRPLGKVLWMVNIKKIKC